MSVPTVSEVAKRANVARNKKLSKKERHDIAVLAAKARWSKKPKSKAK